LNWTTSFEQGIENFEIEQSADGINFTKIATVSAKNNQTGNSYSLMANQLTGYSYYRLRINEKTRNSGFSKTLLVKTNCNHDRNYLSIFPNPVQSDRINIRLLTNYKGKANLILVAATGRQMIRKEFFISNTITSLSLETRQLPSGIYYVQVVDDSGKILNEVIKIIKE
jgi:hypothetical protein